MKRLLLATLLISLCSCTPSIVLKNPRTGELAQCNGKWDNNYASTCAVGYLADGWQRLN